MTAWTGHGGRTDLARVGYPHAPLPWLDLSTGINPDPWSGLDFSSVDAGPLPLRSQLVELEQTARAHFGGAGLEISALPGSEVGMRLLRFVDLPEPRRYVWPSYATHRVALPRATAISIDMLEVEAARGGTILLANPNNPDGRTVSPERLLAAAALLGNRGGRLIVDEAFADASPNVSVVPHLSAQDPVVVFRSFGKFFGLAGARLGFVLAPAKTASCFHNALGDWPVGAHALALGLAAYKDRPWVERTLHALREKAEALDALLRRRGLHAQGDCPLFRLVEIDDAQPVFERLARHGILTRAFDYAPDWLRIGLPADAAALDRLDRALADG